jgi:hypothetical protein
MGSHVSMWRSGRAILPFAVLACTGCSNLAVFLGLRVRLDKLPVTSISASLVSKGSVQPVTALAPGQAAQLVVVANTSDGKQLITVGAGHGKVLLDSFLFTPALVQINSHGKVSLPADPRISEGKIATLHLDTVGHPDVVADLRIAVRYDVPFLANFSGAAGSKGFDGTDGLEGAQGASAMPSPPDPTTGLPGPEGPGGNGGNGGNGGDGSNGGDGAPGAAVHLWLRLESASAPLLQAKVSGGGRDLYYLIDPNGGTLKVTADGGPGGPGGSGGRAGRGGLGGSGNPSGFSGLDGRPGSDGLAGSPGAPGTITVSVDPTAQPYEHVLVLSDHSGSGRTGPAPTFVIEPVPPLW